MQTQCKIPQFTPDAQSCVELAKAIATVDGCREVSAVHIVRAALHLYPEETADSLGVDGDRGSLQAAGLQPLPIAGVRMRPSETFATLLKHLQTIARRPCIRVTQLLASIGAQMSPAHKNRTQALPYRAAQEHLQDVHRLWRLRAAACESAGSQGFERDGNFTTSATSLWSVAMALQNTIEYRSCAPARVLPVRSEDPCTREVLEGLIVHEFYGLGQQYSPGLEIRHLARFVLPGSGWLRALDDVANSVTDLEGRDLVERSRHSVHPRPTDVLRLTETVVADVLEALRADPFTSEELDVFALQLRHLRAV